MANQLLMHVYPRIGGPWRESIDEIRRRLHLFDGKRVIGIVHGNGLENPDAVQREIEDIGTDWIVVPNNPDLREVATMRPGIEIVERYPGRVFYCHTKGATHGEGSIVHEWRQLAFEICLDYPALVECVMKTAKTCGPFRRFEGLGVGWHFSGSFYWFSAEAVLQRHWRYVQEVWYGVETFPACNFHEPESACLFLDRCGDLYHPDYWRLVVRPALAAWREKVRPCIQ